MIIMLRTPRRDNGRNHDMILVTVELVGAAVPAEAGAVQTKNPIGTTRANMCDRRQIRKGCRKGTTPVMKRRSGQMALEVLGIGGSEDVEESQRELRLPSPRGVSISAESGGRKGSLKAWQRAARRG